MWEIDIELIAFVIDEGRLFQVNCVQMPQLFVENDELLLEDVQHNIVLPMVVLKVNG